MGARGGGWQSRRQLPPPDSAVFWMVWTGRSALHGPRPISATARVRQSTRSATERLAAGWRGYFKPQCSSERVAARERGVRGRGRGADRPEEKTTQWSESALNRSWDCALSTSAQASSGGGGADDGEEELPRAGWVSMMLLEWSQNAVWPPGSKTHETEEDCRRPRPAACAAAHAVAAARRGASRCCRSRVAGRGQQAHRNEACRRMHYWWLRAAVARASEMLLKLPRRGRPWRGNCKR